MTLPEYIQQVGAAAFAAQFGITERAALAYRYCERVPRRSIARRITAETPLTLDDIYGEHVQPVSKRPRTTREAA